MKEAQIRIVLPVVAVISLLVMVGAIILRRSKSLKTPAPDSTAASGILPQKPPVSLEAVTIPTAPCLATSPEFTELRTCTKQSDCASCTESPTSCVVVGGEGGVEADGTLTYPVSVNVALPLSAD